VASSFHQWRATFSKNVSVRQVTWVCGPERILVDEIVASTVRRLSPESWNLSRVVVGETPERVIWQMLEQHPIDVTGPRVVVIRHAERLKKPDRLVGWISRKSLNPNTYLIFISEDESLPKVEDEYPEWVKALSGTKGYAVECRPFTVATAKHAVPWVKSKINLPDKLAGHLLNRANGDLRVVRDACLQLSVLPEVSVHTINALLDQRPRESFVDALMRMDRHAAMEILNSVDVGEYSQIIGLLDSRLEVAGKVFEGLLEHKAKGDLSRSLGKFAFLLPDILPVAKHYDSARRIKIRKLLAMADEAIRNGQTTAVMEVVVFFW
jgi:DNA polymerase III delta subunit